MPLIRNTHRSTAIGLRNQVQGRRSATGRPVTAGFTLFEVAISLVLLAFGVISILMIFPMGLKSVQLSRLQLFAAAKAQEIVENFSTVHFDNTTSDTEGPTNWEAASSYRSQTWDLDARIASHRYGMMPLPLDLARRLDSDGDEISRILAEGGYVYYSQPLASTGLREQSQGVSPPNEAQKMIIGITGYAQQNAMPIFPMKNWPYLASFPSPPLHYAHRIDDWVKTPGIPSPNTTPSTARDFYDIYSYAGGGESRAFFWESHRILGTGFPGSANPVPGTDPDMQKVVDWTESGVRYGYVPYGFSATAPTRDAAIRYVQAALWYCSQKRLPPTFWDSTNDVPQTSRTVVPGFITGTAPEEKWKQVQAMRFLSHAATCLTSWYSLSAGAPAEDLTRGVRIPPVTLDSVPGPAELLITDNLIRYYHERGVRLAMEFAAYHPYDWAVPRPIDRTIMTDYPLLQYDLFSPPIQGTIWGTAGIRAEQWRPLSPRPIRNIGLSSVYPINPDASGRQRLEATTIPQTHSHLFGNLDHYSLAMPFEASERCREIVFWSVDWQSYEDFETLPSAPLDASRYPICSPRASLNPGPSTLGTPENFNARMSNMTFVDPHLFCYRNPEKSMLWVNTIPASLQTGEDVSAHQILNGENGGPVGNRDQGSGLVNRMTFNGQYGADRNFNKKIDRGPVPRSVRLRATEVARFNFYDPRIPCILR